MAAAYAFIPFIFNIFIIAVIIFSIKNRLNGQIGRKSGIRKDNPNVNSFNEMVSHYNKVNNKTSTVKLQDSMTLKDDRSNDWMARQLRDEAIAMVKVSDMFKLKQTHMNNCDAEFIKRFHESSCDANGVDDGTHKKSGRK